MTFHGVTDTKRIAAFVGTSPGTVKTQINAAMRKLGVNDRRVAAAMLAAEEIDREARPLDAGDALASTPAYTPVFTPARMMDVPREAGDPFARQPDPVASAVQEERTAHKLGLVDVEASDLRRRINNLSVGLRVVVIATIAITVAVLVLLTVPTSNRAQVIGSVLANHL